MKNECSIVRDILTLYSENMVSSDTAEFVEAHLKSCAACRKEYEQINDKPPMQETVGAVPLLKLRKKMQKKRIQTIALTAVFVAALLVSAIAVLSAPTYFPYSEGLIAVEPAENNGLRLTFDKAVTDFDCSVYPDPKSGDFYRCDIQAWTSLWDKWFAKDKGALSTTVYTEDSKPIIAEYLPNDGSENVCVYGNIDADVGIVLPRLVLGYYLILAAAAFIVLAIVWLFVRKKKEIRVWIERLALYPIAYMLGHCIVSGIFSTVTYSMPRDFLFIVFLSILLYGGLLLAHGILYLKNEIRQTNQL